MNRKKLVEFNSKIIKSLDYKDIGLISRQKSEIEHRNECDTGIDFCGIRLDIPMIASPMNDVCGGEMAYKLAELGAFGFIHRFQNIDQQVEEYKNGWVENIEIKREEDIQKLRKSIGCAVGVVDDFKERFKRLYDEGCRIFCLDTANGHNIQVEKAIKWIRDNYNTEHVYLTAGNIATREGFRFLAELSIDYVRVGIGSGSPCSTRYETGIYNHPISVLLECIDEKYNIHNDNTMSDIYPNTKIMLDGGIKRAQDLCKAISIGADVIMAGGIFAGTDESPGTVETINGMPFKFYRGAASYSTQRNFKNKKPEYVEGEEKQVPYIGSVEKVIRKFKHGMQSSMSYTNASNIVEYKYKTEFVLL